MVGSLKFSTRRRSSTGRAGRSGSDVDPGFRYWPPSFTAEASVPGKVWSDQRRVEIAGHQAGGVSKGPHLVPTMVLDLYALISHGIKLPSMTYQTCCISSMALVAKAGSTRPSVR